MAIEVMYLDNHVMAVYKEAGVLSQSDITGDVDLLTMSKNFLKKKFNKPGNVFLGLVHRLDRPVSGVMVFARTSKAAARLTRQFKDHKVEKRYMAIVGGNLRGAGNWKDFMVKDGRNARITQPDHPKGKVALLSWKALAHQDSATLVSIKLQTGRAHQIRLQFATRGFPLLGDIRYGSPRQFDGKNLALHAGLLAIDHPVNRQRLRWEAFPPKSWSNWFPQFHDLHHWRLDSEDDKLI